MTDLERKKVNQLTSIGTLQAGDVVVGERTSGTTGLLTVGSLGGVSDGDKGDITVADSGATWTIDTPTVATVATDDKVLIKDTSANNVMKYVTAQSIADLAAGGVTSVNGETGAVTIDADDIDDTSTTNKFVTSADLTKLSNLSGTNSGDQTSIVGITGTKAQFDTAVTDGNILYVGDVTQYTDEMAQDAVGAMIDSSLTYVDATPLLQRAALTGDVTAAAGSNSTTIANDAVTYAKMQNVSATDKLLGRSSSGAGDVEEITCTAAGRALIDDADATAQRTTLGLAIGTDVQAYDAELAALAGLTSAANKFPYFTGSGTAALADISSAMRDFLTTSSSANLRALLTDEVGTGAAYFVGGALGTPASGTLTNCAGLKSLGSGLTAFRAHKAANQTISNITWTKVQLDTEDFDSGSIFDNATNYRYTPNIAGKYNITAIAAFASLTVAKTMFVGIYFNGALFASASAIPGATSDSAANVSIPVSFNGSTDYVELYVWQNTGGNLTLYGTSTYLAGCLIEAA